MNVSLRTEVEARSIDLNADLGEGFPNDRRLIELVTSASVCCGGHAGGAEVSLQTLRDALARGVIVGAHPGYADPESFGRREHSLGLVRLIEVIQAQVAWLIELATGIGVNIAYLKPHGAMYNQAQRQIDVAGAVARAAEALRLPLLGQPGSLMEAEARRQHVPFVAEGFPDRRYRADGSLVPRSESNAVLHDHEEIKAQVLRLVSEGKVATLCIHGDDPRAVANAELVRGVLSQHGIAVRPFRCEVN